MNIVNISCKSPNKTENLQVVELRRAHLQVCKDATSQATDQTIQSAHVISQKIEADELPAVAQCQSGVCVLTWKPKRQNAA